MNSSDIPHGEECASNRRGSSPGCLYRIPRIHYSEKTMWNVEERFSPKAIESLAALGFPTFYNEALGSVSKVSVYDRVKGRKGDVPDETVGAHVADGGH